MNRISGNLLNSLRDIICQPLTEIINCSFERRIFPKYLKLACVTPLYKGCNKLELHNYKPISVNPIVGKVVEKCMFTRIKKKSIEIQY